MKGFEVKFNVYADTQEEADEASAVLRQFVDNNARRGVPVTAKKITVAVNKWKDNYFVNRYFGNGREEM